MELLLRGVRLVRPFVSWLLLSAASDARAFGAAAKELLLDRHPFLSPCFAALLIVGLLRRRQDIVSLLRTLLFQAPRTAASIVRAIARQCLELLRGRVELPAAAVAALAAIASGHPLVLRVLERVSISSGIGSAALRGAIASAFRFPGVAAAFSVTAAQAPAVTVASVATDLSQLGGAHPIGTLLLVLALLSGIVGTVMALIHPTSALRVAIAKVMAALRAAGLVSALAALVKYPVGIPTAAFIGLVLLVFYRLLVGVVFTAAVITARVAFGSWTSITILLVTSYLGGLAYWRRVSYARSAAYCATDGGSGPGRAGGTHAAGKFGSRPCVNDVTKLNKAPVSRIFYPLDAADVQYIVRLAGRHGRAVSMRGTAHTMGGHTIAKGGYVIDMGRMKQVCCLLNIVLW